MSDLSKLTNAELSALLESCSQSADFHAMGHIAPAIREAASRLQAPAVAEWQPIETAPQDGTQVLAPCGYGFLDVLTYSDGAWRETSNLLRARHQPTVWQPLPAAPGGSE
ncbi:MULTISPECIES: hypothetical protein [Aurantimonas]|jgi:protoheme ferro-lyase|uniref:hypothetical protein n=1 Tax=Aurantimonas TaxID=182269 RepID=UPI0035159485